MTPRPPVHIAGRPVGADHPPYIVAELSGNHRGELARALQILDAAHRCGADAIKLQTYTADTLTIDAAGPDFLLRGGPWDGRRLYDLYQEAQTPWDWHGALFERARAIGITAFSSPFDATAVDLLEELGAPAYKIASFEIVDLPLIRRVARTGKPMLMSTGIADLGEITEAVRAAREAGCGALILLHCVSGYPSLPAEANLKTLAHLGEAFDVQVGLSDHTLGVAVPIAAVALGATVIEKHFTLRRADGGPDAGFSLEPDELARLVEGARTAWEALGRVDYSVAASEAGNRVFRRSLYVVQDVAEGEELTERNVRVIRPGFGLAPRHLEDVLGSKATRALWRGERLQWDMVGARRRPAGP